MEAAIVVPQKKKHKKKNKNQPKTFKPIDSSYSEFKKAEKKYRIYKDFITDFSGLLDFTETLDISPLPIEKKKIKGLTVYKFLEPQGVYLVKDFLSIPEQLTITLRCLNEYHKKPYRTNLFIYENNDKSENNNSENINTKENPSNYEAEEQKSIMMSEDKMSVNLSAPYNKEKFFINEYSRYCFDRKIRWSNVGYQYDWNNRNYPSEKTSLPIDLFNLSEKTKDFIKEELPDVFDYKAESTIINYYDAKNFMGGHLDDGEKDQKHPIFSYSFGLSCVFLMGGKTKDVKPWAIKLDSGTFIHIKFKIFYNFLRRFVDYEWVFKKLLSWFNNNTLILRK